MTPDLSGLVRIRASGLADLFDCPSRWEWRNLMGRSGPASAASAMGTAIHAGAQAFDVARVQGSPIKPGDAAEATVQALRQPAEEVDWEDTTPKQRERVALTGLTLYCTTLAPALQIVGVEVDVPPLPLPDLGIYLTGQPDRVVVTHKADGTATLAPGDIKTGKLAVDDNGRARTSGHMLQLAQYAVMLEQGLGQPVDGDPVIAGIGTGREVRAGLGRINADRARAALLGTDDEPGALQQAAHIIRAGVFQANPRSMICTQKYCPRYSACRFHD